MSTGIPDDHRPEQPPATGDAAPLAFPRDAGAFPDVLPPNGAEHQSLAEELLDSRRLLEELRERNVELYDFSPFAMATLDRNGVVLELNLAAVALLRMDRLRIVGFPLVNLVDAPDRRRFLDHLHTCRESTAPGIIELRLALGRRTPFPVEISTRSTKAGPNAPIVIRIGLIDLRGRREREQELSRTAVESELALSAGGTGLWVYYPSDRSLHWSPEHFHLLGLDVDSVTPSLEVWSACVHEQDRPHFDTLLTPQDSLHTIELEYRVAGPENTVRWLLTRGRRLPSTGNAQSRLIGTTMDVTTPKRGEVRLWTVNEALRERLSSIEEEFGRLRQLAGELAHVQQRERRQLALVLHDHLQQILAAAKFHLSGASRAVGDTAVQMQLGKVDRLLDEAIESSRSLAVELSPPILTARGLGPALEWLSRWMHEKHQLDVTVQVDPHLPLLHIGPEVSAFLFHSAKELLFNVVKHAGVRVAELHASVRQAGGLTVQVSDRGKGFDATRGETPKSTGFGLYSIEQRARVFGGSLTFQSAPADGTQITLRIPMANIEGRESALPAAEAVTPPSGRSDGEARVDRAIKSIRILVADDHDLLRQELVRILEREADMEVVGQAIDGNAAVELTLSLRPDVVLMDVTMPHLNGLEATQRICQQVPGVKVVGLSMYAGDEMAQEMLQRGAVGYVRKNESPRKLLEAIRAAVKR